MFSPHFFRPALLLGAISLISQTLTHAAEPARIVFQNGTSVLMNSADKQGERLVIKTAGGGFTAGQSFPLTSVSHVYGDKPPAINSAIALLLTGAPGDALKLLEPLITEHQITASFPGNFWIEAARPALVAYAMEKNSAKVAEIGKQIADSTPAQGADPFAALGRALMMPSTSSAEERETALRDLTTDNLPADLCAYASFFRGNHLKTLNRNPEALEAYLMVPCLFPSGGMILNAAAQLRAAELIAALGEDRRHEAVALLESAIIESAGTLLSAEANKRLESLK
jgi:hypothetical protein